MLDKPLAGLDAWVNDFARRPIPVLRLTHGRIGALRSEENKVDAAQVAAEVLADPLLTVRVFAHAARLRAGRDHAEVGTVTRALVLMGIPPFFRANENMPIVEAELGRDPHYMLGLLRVIGRAQRAAGFAGVLAAWRNDLNAEEILVAALLHDFAEMLLWCFAAPLAAGIRAMQEADPRRRSVTLQRAALGIELLDLQQALAHRWQLPELLVQMMDDHHAENPRVRNVVLAVNLARHSEAGWDNPALPDDYQAIASLLSTTPERVRTLVRPQPGAAGDGAPAAAVMATAP